MPAAPPLPPTPSSRAAAGSPFAWLPSPPFAWSPLLPFSRPPLSPLPPVPEPLLAEPPPDPDA
eukprot:9152633-Alexandrium_andersonii.AAC.1